MRISAVLLFAAFLLTATAYLRAPEYDEAYSIFLTAGHARPAWPTGIFHPADVRALYAGTASPSQIAHDLRAGDVHPPLYFWALEFWRRLAGPSWFAARMLSVVFSLGALVILARLAAIAAIPVIPALLLTLLSYGFAYTGIVARGFALAQLLNIAGVACLLAAQRRQSWRYALAGGLAFGAASFSNYLASFTAFAALLWLLLACRGWRLVLPAALGFVLFLPADGYFFIAQKSSRIGQFHAFAWPHALAQLAKDAGAAWFGGLPLYAGRFGLIVTLALAALFILCIATAWCRRPPAAALFALAALATPAGLLALGVVFHNTPIEIRYLAFSLPCLALLLASLPKPLLLTLLAVQAAGIAGLIAAPATMQPQALAARRVATLAMPDALILLPYGNDGVGIPGPFIQAANPTTRILLIKSGDIPSLAAEHRVILATLNVDDASRRASSEAAALLSNKSSWQALNANHLIRAYQNLYSRSLPPP